MKKSTKKNTHHDDVKVKRGISGFGLFAKRAFTRGEQVIEYRGELISVKDGDTRDNRYIFNVNSRTDIDGSPRWNIARYANHSCKPNAEAVDYSGRVYIVAKRRIGEGEEITYNYGKEYFEHHIFPKGCRCVRCGKGKDA
jgi:SET domain-containing protein